MRGLVARERSGRVVVAAWLIVASSIAAAAPDATADDEAGIRAAAMPGLRVASRSIAQANTKSVTDALLADDNLEEPPSPTARFYGFDQLEVAYTLPRPAHFSKVLNRLELGAQGSLTADIKWKVSGRFDYNAIYDLDSFYSTQVRDNQRYDGQFRETYLDFSAGDVDLRIGRQQIIWGEVVGLFVADVVSAKDLRESIVQDFDLLRIPQWAARGEYFKNDIHVEAIWIPFPSVNKIGKPGSDFFPYPPPPPAGYGYVINNERKPREDASESNYGLRASILRGGWDVAAFAYRSVDASPTFLRQVVAGPAPAFVYTPVHDKITQYGATLSKDFNDFLVKAEAVYTVGQNFNVSRLSDADGVVRQNYLDYIVSVEVPFADETRVNAQFFQRVYTDHDPDIIPSKTESGVTLFWSTKWAGRLEPQLLLIHSLNRSDWLARPRLVWSVAKDWRVVAGGDIFGGSPRGVFGQYDKQDRVYVEARKSF